MKINKVIIDNFRNIIHAEYDLTNKNIFAGPNRRGKTNTILAIYWALAEAILSGSNDYTSFKPLHDPSLDASVELVFDTGFIIKKIYKQTYTKEKATGHTTDYWINDEPTPQTDALKKMKKYLGTNRELDADKVDLTQVLSDPYYLSEKLDYKLLRKFVTELIGDIDDKDVIASDTAFAEVADILQKYGYDTVATSKVLKDRINSTKKEVEEFRNQIKGLERVQDVDPEIFERSKKELIETDQELAKLNQSKLSLVNPNIAIVEKEISDIQLKLSESLTSDREHLDKQNQTFNNRLIPLNDKSKLLNELLTKETDQLFEAKSKVSGLMNFIDTNKMKLEAKQKIVVDKRKEWIEVNNREFKPLAHVVDPKNCPHCGGVLNKEALDQQTVREKDFATRFEQTKQSDLNVIVAAGNEAKNDIENLTMILAEKQKELVSETDKQNELMKLTEDRKAEIKKIQEEIMSINAQLSYSYESDKTKDLRLDLLRKQESLSLERKVNYASDIDSRINEVHMQQEEFKKIIDLHRTYVTNQKTIKIIETDIEKKLDIQTRLESQMAAVNEFMKAKLDLIRMNAEKVFGTRVSLTLIEPNLKNEGWQQVCYFSVLDKDTPFIHGSGSEKILTGIYLIECVKRHLGIDDLPIIFDECDKLDTAAIAGLATHAQIITTKVDDQNYKDVTLLSI